uniref:Uncharacterized protein n=1 Tax=Pediastrum angulosum TaxID=271408 RepID=A0A2U8GHW4_9CHLO|nr:hypothetical protein [Pediastrum angulosum]
MFIVFIFAIFALFRIKYYSFAACSFGSLPQSGSALWRSQLCDQSKEDYCQSLKFLSISPLPWLCRRLTIIFDHFQFFAFGSLHAVTRSRTCLFSYLLLRTRCACATEAKRL